MPNVKLAVIQRPGIFIEDELRERGWSQLDLAEVLGRAPRLVNELIMGKRSITPETAKGLEQAFATPADYWMRLESLYQLSKVKDYDDSISRRAKLFSDYPVREMIRRGWVANSNDLDQLENDFSNFFKDGAIVFNSHLRKTNPEKEELTIDQKAWIIRVYQLCQNQKVPEFSMKKFNSTCDDLKSNLGGSDLRVVPEILQSAGIRFVVVENLPGNKIDGVCFWINKGKNPVVALSLRNDRIDSFWFTLFHECGHLFYEHGKEKIVPDTNLVGKDAQRTSEKNSLEKQADKFASDAIIDEEALISFANKVYPYFSKRRIKAFADDMKVHPGLVVGQLQHRGYIPYSHSREMLEKVRDQLTAVSITDGWGIKPM